ncbi:MAG: bestrophin [Nannocystaceae bacterium]|nr:bestrophin [Nannocystaceae bacterium]
MIVDERRTWWQQLSAWRGTALQRIWPRLALVMAASAVLTWLHVVVDRRFDVLTPLPFSLVGVALGIFLGFRNNASYDRFWEGRRLWGELVNTSRSFARQVLTLVEPEPAAPQRRQALIHATAGFAHALRGHLRGEPVGAELDALLDDGDREAVRTARHAPLAILSRLGESLAQARRAGAVDPLHVPVLEASLTALTGILGACERIRNTPLPASYTVLIHRIVAVYVFTLPFGILDGIGPFTPIVVGFIAYALLGLDAIGDELENPFGTDANDLPLATLCRGIEINLREALGERELPPPLPPRDGVAL